MLFKLDSSDESETRFVMTIPVTKLERERKQSKTMMEIKQSGIDREINILEESNLSPGEKEKLISRRQTELQQIEDRNLHLDDVMTTKIMERAKSQHYKVRDDIDQYEYVLNGHGVSPWMKNEKEDWYRTQTTQVEGIDHPVLQFFNTSDFTKYIYQKSQMFIKLVKDDLFRNDPEITDQELIEKFQEFLNLHVRNQ